MKLFPLPSPLKPLAASLVITFISFLLTACGVVQGGTSSALLRPTTTLQAETANNTSAADSFKQQTNGNLGPGNVSKVPLRSLLYSESTTKLYVTWLPWFGRADHMNVGYRSDDPAQVHRQVEDMISRGIDGAIADWSGPDVTSIENATQLLKAEAETHTGHFEFAIMEDASALGSAATANGCDVTDELISDLSYIAAHYASSPAYMRWKGRPVIFFFGVDGFYIDWPRVLSTIPGNPLLIFQGTDGFTRRLSDGGFSWININSNDPFDSELASQDDFYKATAQAPARIAFGSAYKGFNDTQAMWGTNRVIDQHCGQTWLETFSEAGKFFSSDHQLPAMQIATWNDYEEGTAIEPGIDNCVYLTPSQSGSTIQWQVKGGDENTIDHYTVFLSTDGTNLSKIADVPRGTHSVDLSALKLPPATYSVYVKAIGAPGIRNKMSPPIAWHPGDQPPAIQLNVSQTGPLTWTASTTGSSGNVARTVIDFGDGTIQTAVSATHSYATVGTYRITASVYDKVGASAVAVQQVSAKSPSGGITIASPADGSTVNWPTPLVASANPGTPVSAMRVLIDGTEAYAAHGDTLNTSLKVFTGTHRITVQSLDAAGNTTASASVNVLAEPDDIPPIANITFRPLPSVSPTTVLGCTATSTDADGFIMSFQLQFSDGSRFTTPAAPRTFAAPGLYKATATVMDQFGATSTTSTTLSVAGGTSPARTTPSGPPPPQQQQHKPLQPMRPPS